MLLEIKLVITKVIGGKRITNTSIKLTQVIKRNFIIQRTLFESHITEEEMNSFILDLIRKMFGMTMI